MKKTFGNNKPIQTEEEWDSVFKKQCKTVAKTLNLSIHEATKRMIALNESDLLKKIDPREPDGQKAIDIFLTNPNWETDPSRVLQSTKKEMAFTEVFLECLSNEEMVRGFDRLRGTSIWNCIRTGKGDVTEKQFRKWMNSFSKFVREFVWARLPEESFK